MDKNKDNKQLAFRIPIELHQAMKLHTVRNGETICHFVERLIVDYLRRMGELK